MFIFTRMLNKVFRFIIYYIYIYNTNFINLAHLLVLLYPFKSTCNLQWSVNLVASLHMQICELTWQEYSFMFVHDIVIICLIYLTS